MIDRAEALRIAQSAAPHWGAAGKAPELITIRENAVFRAVQNDGAAIALRLHRPGYQTRAGIEAELAWTEGLAVRGLPVPRPVHTLDGSMTWTTGGIVVSAVGWLQGEPVGHAGIPLAGDRATQVGLFGAIGRLLADLHRATDALALPADLPRPRWDRDGLLGANPVWGRFWENPGFDRDGRALVDDVRVFADDHLAGMGTSAPAFGLIHADALRENILADRDGALRLIDFDDSGYGYRMYDLGTALVQSLEEPHLPDLAAALLDGYGAGGGHVGDGMRGLMLFTLLRCLASAGWIVSRAAPDDPRQLLYVNRVLRLAPRVLAGQSEWPQNLHQIHARTGKNERFFAK